MEHPCCQGAPITHYEYRQRVDEDDAPWQPDWTAIPDSSAQTTSYTIAGLTNGTTYRFRVRAVNAAGASGTARTTATVATSPDPPGGLSATPGDGQVILRWSVPAANGSPITHYEYRQRVDEDNAPWQPDWTAIPDSSAQTTSYTIAGLTNGITYRFRVRAVNAVGASGTARTTATPVSPNRPPTLDGPGAVSFAENSLEAVGTYTATDPDGDPLTWLLTGADAAAFQLQGSRSTHTLHFEQPPDFERQPTYAVAVVVSDAAALSATVAVTVTVSNVDEPGTIALSSTQPRVGEPITATLTDPDGRVTNVGWTWSSGTGTADGLTSTVTPTQDMVGTRLQATATYEDGQGSGKSAQSIQTAAVVGRPDPVGGLSATPGDGQVTLGWTTPAANGSPITHYEYRQRLAEDDAPWQPDWTTIPNSAAETTSYTIADLTNGRAYTFEVRAVNAVGEGPAARTTATAVSPNRPPTLDGPGAVSFAENSLEAVGTYTATDPDDDPLLWSLTGGNARAFELQGTGTSRTLYFRQAPDFETQPGYTVEVVVTDGSLSAAVAVAVRVSNVDEPGTIALSSTQPRVGEPVTATLADPDGRVSTVEWTWSSGSGTADGLTSTLTPTQDMVGTRLQVTAYYEDGQGPGKSARSAQTEAVLGPPDAPGSLSATPGDEQVTLGWSVPADHGAPITHYEYRQRLAEDDAPWSPDWTTIPDSHGPTTRYAIADLANGRAYTFEVRAVNAVGEGPSARTTARLLRPLTLDGPGTVSFVENSSEAVATYTALNPDPDYTALAPDGADLTWLLGGRDAHAFALQGRGLTRTLHFRQPPDFEAQPTYTVAVGLAAHAALPATVAVTVRVANVDEPGTIALSSTQPRVGTPITATLADPDGGVSQLRWSWSSGSGTADGLTSTVTPTQDMAGTRLQATAHYADGQGPNKSAQSIQTAAVLGPPDAPGSLSATPGDEQVRLGWTTPAAHGAPITRYAYRLSDDGGRTWQPDWTTIPNSAAETTSYTIADLTNGTEYTFEVRAVNAVGEGPAARTTATPVAPNRPPTLDGPGAVSLAENSLGAVGTYTATDPDDDNLTWSLTGTDVSAFELQGTGTSRTLHFQRAPDFETQSAYTVAVVVTDGSLSATVAVSVTVSNVDEPGTIALSSTQPRVGEPITATLADPDGGVVQLRWSWSSGSGTADGLTSTVTPTQDMAGTRLQATAHYADGHGAGKSARSVQTEAVVGRPAPVGSLSATPGNEQVVLGWSTPADHGAPITHYTYRLSDDGGTTWSPDWTTIPNSDAQTTSYTLAGLTNGREYTIGVRAVNAVGAGEAARTTATPATVPAAVANLKATPGNGQVVLRWEAPASDGGAAITGYESRYSRTSHDTWTASKPAWAAVAGGSSARSQTVSGLTNGSAYTFEVRPVNAAGEGLARHTSATPATVPPVVANLKATAGDRQVTLGWSAPASDGGAAITHYQYQRSGGSWTTVSGGAAARRQTVSGLTNGTTYTFSVRAVNRVGGGAAKSITATPVKPKPDPPKPKDTKGTVSVSPQSPYVGDTVTAKLSDPDNPTNRSWNWGGSGLSATYTAKASDVGKQLTASVSYSDDFGSGKSKSASTDKVKAKPCSDTEGKVSVSPSKPRVGGTLTATLIDPDNPTGLSWTWKGSISGATYTAKESDKGNKVPVSVSYSDDCGSQSAVGKSNEVWPEFNPCRSGSVSLTTSSPVVGVPVTATLTDLDGGITGARWRWSRLPWPESAASTAYPELSSYTPSESDVGSSLQASVFYNDNCKAARPPNTSNIARSNWTLQVKAASGKPVSLHALPDSVLAAIAAPNPFNPTTTLHIQLPATGPVSLTIYNMAGQVVRSLWDHRVLEAGYHAIDWDSRDSQGQPVTSGVYLYRVQTTTQTLVHKMLLLR